ncbi:ATP-binding cassette transporter [Clonorchis sinensis]|uniref:ATP-binding cassette transporter n=1 Tax=Clonorchis sinensis TaxID=79923 RepID=G7YUZ3_CLOSI|nr:ATP-binding cassette transporter [Clonorchis sinensis]
MLVPCQYCTDVLQFAGYLVTDVLFEVIGLQCAILGTVEIFGLANGIRRCGTKSISVYFGIQGFWQITMARDTKVKTFNESYASNTHSSHGADIPRYLQINLQASTNSPSVIELTLPSVSTRLRLRTSGDQVTAAAREIQDVPHKIGSSKNGTNVTKRPLIFIRYEVTKLQLRLTKTAYIQQNERKSLGRHLSRPTDQKSPKQKKRLNVPSNESSTTQPLSAHRTATVNTPVFKLEHVFSMNRSDEDKLLKDQAMDTYHLKPKADAKNPKCTLFTRISTETSSDFSGVVEKCKLETSKIYLGRPARKASTSAQSEGGSDVDERKPANELGGSHTKSAVKRNLRNLLPQSFSSTKADANCWVHRSDIQDKQLRLPARSTETNHLDPRTISEPTVGTSKHADVMSSKEIIQQARKYGTPNFVARMRNELRRAQTTSEPLEGYWIPRRHLYSFDLLKTKQETLRSGARRLRSVPVRAVPLQDPSSLNRYRELSTGLIKPAEISSSCAGSVGEYALKKLGSVTSKLSNAETSNSVHGCTIPLNSGAAPTDQGFVTSEQVASDKNDYPLETSPKRKRSTVSRQVVHPVKKTGDPSNSEQLKKLALVTASALTEALGIPSNDLKTQIVQGSGEAVVDSKPKASKVSRKMNRASEEVKTVKDVKISDASTTSSADNVVYRVRVESVRHYRLQQADCYRDFYAPSTTHLPNPTPPMSIVLRGMNCSSPSLELVSAELARLGEVAGHTVILRDPQMLGRRSAGAKHVFGDVPVRKPLSPSFIATITNEGCPQVDYFAIVCSSLGKITGVDIRPVPNGVKNIRPMLELLQSANKPTTIYATRATNILFNSQAYGRYEWFIKKITIDELERQKKYHFSCDQWLTLEAKNIPCKRVRTSPKVKMMKKSATVSVPQNTLSHCSVPQANGTQLLSERHAAGVSKTCSLKQASDFLPEVVDRGPKVLKPEATCTTGSNGTACALRSAVESVLFQLPKIHTLLGFVSTSHGLRTDELSSSEEAGQLLSFSLGQAPAVAEVETWASYIAEWYAAVGISSQLFVNQADFPDRHHLQPVHERFVTQVYTYWCGIGAPGCYMESVVRICSRKSASSTPVHHLRETTIAQQYRYELAQQISAVNQYCTGIRPQDHWISSRSMTDTRKSMPGGNEYDGARKYLKRQLVKSLREDREPWWISKAQEMKKSSATGNSHALYHLMRSTDPRKATLPTHLLKSSVDETKLWQLEPLCNKYAALTAESDDDLSKVPPFNGSNTTEFSFEVAVHLLLVRFSRLKSGLLMVTTSSVHRGLRTSLRRQFQGCDHGLFDLSLVITVVPVEFWVLLSQFNSISLSYRDTLQGRRTDAPVRTIPLSKSSAALQNERQCCIELSTDDQLPHTPNEFLAGLQLLTPKSNEQYEITSKPCRNTISRSTGTRFSLLGWYPLAFLAWSSPQDLSPSQYSPARFIEALMSDYYDKMLPATRALFVDDVKSYPSFLRAICGHVITFLNDCDSKATRIGKIDELPIPDLVTAIETCSPLPVFGINFATQCHTNIPRIASIQPYSPEYLDEPSDGERYTYPTTVISGRNSEMERTVSIEDSQPVEVYGLRNRSTLDTEDIITPPENGKLVIQADLNSWSSTNELQQELGLLEPVDPATVDTKDTTENRGPLQVADVYFDPNYSATVTTIDEQSARNATQGSQCSNISLPFLNDGALEERLRQIAGLSINKPAHSSRNGTDGQTPEYYFSSELQTPIQEQDPTDKFELRHLPDVSCGVEKGSPKALSTQYDFGHP